jgi:hypothetical protein
MAISGHFAAGSPKGRYKCIMVVTECQSANKGHSIRDIVAAAAPAAAAADRLKRMMRRRTTRGTVRVVMRLLMILMMVGSE